MIYQFDDSTYLLSVKKVHPIPAPGCGKIAQLIKVVFEAYRWVDEETVTRCEEERIAQHIYLILSEGHSWQTQDDKDRRFLQALGLPPRLDLSVDIKKELTGRWIEGRPGPPGPDGFNPLEEFKAIESPVATTVYAASPVSGFASTSAVSQVDTSASAVPNPPVPTRGTPRQSRRLEDERTRIGLVAASEFYDIPKSTLSKAAAKNPGERGYLPSTRKGRRVFFDEEEIQNLSRSRKQMKRQSKQPAKVPDLTSVSRLFRQD